MPDQLTSPRKHISRLSLSICLLLPLSILAQTPGNYAAIHSGAPWLDNHGETVSAHGANIIKDQGRYYLFGEAHTDAGNAFAGFSCYSSSDLYNWRFDGIALVVRPDGDLGPGTVGERPKVMRSPGGEYIMFMHVDTLDYKGQFVGYATSKAIAGPYAYQGPLLYEDKRIRKWDMGTFQDQDGAGYVLLHGGDIYKLADDYKSITAHVNKAMTSGFEAPTLFRKDDTYYFLGSELTGWERNDNYYFTATSLNGPWTLKGAIAPAGTLTWNSQVTFVLPVAGTKDTTYMFMGDRWSYPRQATAASYVWQPLVVKDGALSMPVYHDAWRIDTATGVASPAAAVPGQRLIEDDDAGIRYSGAWRHEPGNISQTVSDAKDDALSFTFTGRQVSIYGLARPDGGYAQVSLRNRKGEMVQSAIVDMYSKYPVSTLKFISPLLVSDSYTVTVTVLGERWSWTSKKNIVSGSAGHAVSLDKIIVAP